MVTWVSVRQDETVELMRVTGDRKKTMTLHFWNFSVLHLLISSLNEVQDKLHVVIIDGYIANSAPGQVPGFIAECRFWVRGGDAIQTRRLIVVSSMGGISKSMPSVNFRVPSWTLEEYMQAVEDDTFFDNVRACLDAGTDLSSSLQDRTDLVIQKFHFAGGFCRGLFEMSTEVLISYFEDAFNRINYPELYSFGFMGDHSPTTLNRLYDTYQDQNLYFRQSLISSYVAVELAIRIGPRLLEQFLQSFKDLQSNPSVKGFFFEAKLFACIRSNRGVLQDKFTLLSRERGGKCFFLSGFYFQLSASSARSVWSFRSPP